MNAPKKLVLSGASGFVGSAIARSFGVRGWSVSALSRSAPALRQSGLTWHSYDLAGPPPDAFENADLFIHAAVATGTRGQVFTTNVEGSRRLFELARRCRVPHRIFVSSLAAQPDALSEYGKSKYAVEQFIDAASETIVRPGLVIGNGGLFARMARFLRTSSVVPIIGSGREPLQAVYLGDMVEAISRIADRRLAGSFTLALPPIAALDFYRLLCTRLNARPRFVRVPFPAAEIAIAIAGLLRVPLPVERDSVLGLKNMKVHDAADDAQRLGLRMHDLEKSIDLALSAAAAQDTPA